MLVHSIHRIGCAWRRAMEDSESKPEEDDDNSPAVTVGLAALAIVLLAIVLGVLTMLVRK